MRVTDDDVSFCDGPGMFKCKTAKACINSTRIVLLIYGFVPDKTLLLIACNTAVYAIILIKQLFFAHNVTFCNSVTFKFWVTLEFSRHHDNLKPQRFDFCIAYKPIDWTCPFRYH